MLNIYNVDLLWQLYTRIPVFSSFFFLATDNFLSYTNRCPRRLVGATGFVEQEMHNPATAAEGKYVSKHTHKYEMSEYLRATGQV